MAKYVYYKLETGAKDAMFGMWRMSWNQDDNICTLPSYVQNIAAQPDEANAKIQAFIDAKNAKDNTWEHVLVEPAEFERNKIDYGPIAIKNQNLVNQVRIDGKIPFGKHINKPIVDLAKENIGYLLWVINTFEEKWVDYETEEKRTPEQVLAIATKTSTKLTVLEALAIVLIEMDQDGLIELAVEANTDAPRSEHIGSVGEKITVVVTVNSVREQSTHFGWTYDYKCTDTNGNYVGFKTVAKSFSEVKSGDQISIQGTVKYHGEYHRQKRTYLNRVKVIANN